MKFIIDTDVGIDDAVALLMVLAHPDAELLAITTVAGNVPLAKVTRNVGVVLDLANAPAIPIYRGCERSLLRREPINAIEIHGEDGLGGAAVPTRRKLEAGHAGLALANLVRQNPGEITLLTLGPLTNIALAIRLAPDFLKGLKKLVVMGGSVDAHGNATPPTEFNILADPEAAAIVFEACSMAQIEMALISWEATLEHVLPLECWEKIIAGTSPVAQFVQKMTNHLKGVWPAPVVAWPDPLAAAVALVPDIVKAQENRLVTVDTGHTLARGQTIADYRFNSTVRPNTNIIRKVDPQKFKGLLQTAILQEASK